MRYLFYCLILLFLLPASGALAQHQRLRNMYRHMADTATKDSIRIKAYSKLTEEYLDSSYSSAMYYAAKSDSLADRYTAWRPGKILAQTAIGYVYQAIDMPDTALHYFHYARSLALTVPNKTYLKKCTFSLFQFYKERRGDSVLYYARDLLQYARQLRDTALEMFAVNELGNFYLERQDYPQAISWWRQVIPVLDGLKQYYRESVALANIGKAYLESGQMDSSHYYLLAAQAAAAGGAHFAEQADVELALSDYYKKAGQADLAQAAAENALQLVNDQDNKPLLRDTWEKLTAIYEQNGRFALALNAHKQYIIYRDSIAHEERNLDDAKRILRGGFAQQLAVIERAQADLKLTGHLQRRLLIAAAFALLLLGALAIVYYTALVKNRKRERTIAAQASLLLDQKTAIQKTLAEKELLMHEIHHRVKNNLQVISSLQQMQASRSTDPAVKAALEDGQNRVLSIALIHENLYQHDGLEGVEMQSFVRELVAHVLNVCSHPQTAIRTDQEIDPVTLDIDTAVPLGLIINELLTNSCKHAFRDRTEGNIVLRLHQYSPGHYELGYEDDGAGLNPSQDFRKAESLGLKLINQLTSQLEGTLTYRYNTASIFTIRFKDFATRNRD